MPDMWRLAQPDVLIYLDANLETIARRRASTLDEKDLAEECRRLLHARHHSTLYLPTDDLTPEEVEARALETLAQARSPER